MKEMKQKESKNRDSAHTLEFSTLHCRVVSKTHGVSNNKNIEEIKIALEAY